jgi:hypothetical protein
MLLLLSLVVYDGYVLFPDAQERKRGGGKLPGPPAKGTP